MLNLKQEFLNAKAKSNELYNFAQTEDYNALPSKVRYALSRAYNAHVNYRGELETALAALSKSKIQQGDIVGVRDSGVKHYYLAEFRFEHQGDYFVHNDAGVLSQWQECVALDQLNRDNTFEYCGTRNKFLNAWERIQ